MSIFRTSKIIEKRNKFIEKILRERIKNDYDILIETKEEAVEFFKKNPDFSLEIRNIDGLRGNNFKEWLIFRKGSIVYDIIEIDYNFMVNP